MAIQYTLVGLGILAGIGGFLARKGRTPLYIASAVFFILSVTVASVAIRASDTFALVENSYSEKAASEDFIKGAESARSIAATQIPICLIAVGGLALFLILEAGKAANSTEQSGVE